MFIDIHTHRVGVFRDSVFNTIVGNDVIPINNWFSLGIHPWYINDIKTQLSIMKTELEKKNSSFLLIGECGLDKIKGADYLIQEAVFKEQVIFSEDFQKPIIIHCVKAYNELIKLKKELSPNQSWVIHGFNRKKTIANSLLEAGMYLSFGLLFLKSSNGAKVLQNTPLNKMFFETDNNSESYIEEVYILASEILEVGLKDLQNQIKQNLWQIIG